MEIITSLENKRIKEFSKLLDKKNRDELNMFLVEGEHLVEEASKKDCLLEVIKTEDCPLSYGVKETIVTYEVLKKLSNTKSPQKIIGVCKKMTSSKIGNKVLVLDNIQDPGNLGTIIRSSVAFNVDTIILSEDTVDMYNDKVIRSSEGMLFHIDIIRCNIKEKIEELKNSNYTIFGTRVDNGEELNNINAPEKYALIMGNEGAGVKKDILDLCDKYIYIKMNEKCESLNVGVATSIILYRFN